MEWIAGVIAIAVALMVIRRTALGRWRAGGLSKDKTAALWAAGLPVALLGYAAVTGSFGLVAIAAAGVLFLPQFLTVRRFLGRIVFPSAGEHR
jgi:hypothetical protein